MYTFKKEERLCSKKLLDELFHKGSSFLLYPYRVSWLITELTENVPAQVVISVPKRKFKRAHDRNLLKRRIREAYRLNKNNLLYPFLKDETPVVFGVSYIGREIHDFQFLEKKIKKVFEQLVREYVAKTLG
ncbi:ribonuclease P protein component [Rubrolithibacter danxiaensis]|uniref:ribonuclease P protein component n=1 Tax=Rubrolithibacter danxiaensis TaxID=3390805 RepID=UPI003BF7BCB3